MLAQGVSIRTIVHETSSGDRYDIHVSNLSNGVPIHARHLHVALGELYDKGLATKEEQVDPNDSSSYLQIWTLADPT